MTRSVLRICAVLSLALAVFCGCRATAGMFTPDEEGQTQAGAVLTTAANATGNPLIIGLVGVLNAGLSGVFHVLARKHASTTVARKDAEEWTAEEAVTLMSRVPPDVLAEILRRGGYKVERA